MDLVESKMAALRKELVDHPGFSELRMDVRFLKKGKKEVVLSSVKQYRFVVNQAGAMADEKRIV